VKFPTSPVASVKALIRHQAAYADHPDPAARAVNMISLMLAWNGPLYPIYVVLLAGRGTLPWVLLTVLISPFFYAIPYLSRVSSRAARLALPLIGTANTVWCIKLFGVESGVGFFLYPCIVLAALLYREREQWFMLPVLGVTLLFEFVPGAAYGPAVIQLSSDGAARLSALNAGSVAFLLAFIALKFIDVARALAKDSGGAAT
jgi:hypothetical protein